MNALNQITVTVEQANKNEWPDTIARHECCGLIVRIGTQTFTIGEYDGRLLITAPEKKLGIFPLGEDRIELRCYNAN